MDDVFVTREAAGALTGLPNQLARLMYDDAVQRAVNRGARVIELDEVLNAFDRAVERLRQTIPASYGTGNDESTRAA